MAFLLLLGCTPADDGDVKADDTAPANADPTASILSPGSGEVFAEGEALVLTVELEDAESPAADLTVAWASTRVGPLVGDTTLVGNVATTVVSGGLGAGDHGLVVSVVDPDGGAATAQVDVVVEANAAPTVVFLAPADGASVALGDPVEVVVAAADAEDAPGALALTWGGSATDADPPTTPDTSGEARFYLTDLAAGAHTLRVTVTDTRGATDTEEILVEVSPDDDGDGHGAEVDCDDDDPAVHPGATEVCDGLDQDCDGAVDEDADGALPWYADDDGDGWGDPATSTVACDPPARHVDNGEDCDDGDPAVNPDGAEVCDGEDNDCDGATDEAGADGESAWYDDGDGDGYGDAGSTVTACAAPVGYVGDAADCDDRDADEHPGADERCDGDDDDCDGVEDEDDAVDAPTWYLDEDGDGWGGAAASVVSCEGPLGYADVTGDCDDADAALSPGATERCDEVDEDCDGVVDDGAADAERWYLDDDGDGYGTTTYVDACEAPAGHVAETGDCDDARETVHPEAAEACDGVDNDCDGATDEELPTWYRDGDRDGYGNASVTTASCTQPSSYVGNAEDCDDGDPAVNPAADEVCGNATDDDCDGATDDATAVDADPWYADTDGDGYGDPGSSAPGCTAPAGHVADDGDCDDTDAETHPGATEQCDGIDHGCDGAAGSGLSVPDDYATPSDALAVASSGDVVCLAAGEYLGPVNIPAGVRVEGAGSADVRIDTNGGRVHLSNGAELQGVTLWGGNQAYGSALYAVCTDPVRLEDVVFEQNQCESVSACFGVAHFAGCPAELVDVTFQDNDISPEAGSVLGGLVYAYGDTLTMTRVSMLRNEVTGASGVGAGLVLYYGGTWTSTDLLVEDNVVTAPSAAVLGGFFAGWEVAGELAGTTFTGNRFEAGTQMSGGLVSVYDGAPDFVHTYVAENVWVAPVLLGGVFYFPSEADPTLTWTEVLDNEIEASTGLYGGIVAIRDASDPLYQHLIVAGNHLTAGGPVYGGLLYAASAPATSDTTVTRSIGRLLFADIVGNSFDNASAVYGAVASGDYGYYADSGYASYHSSAWDFTMVNVVGTTLSSTRSLHGSVYYDDSATYDYGMDWDYSNIYDNDGTAFENATDPYGTSGNVQVDPLYTDASLSSAVYWDLTLQSTSPVRNAGDPSSTYLDTDGTYAAIGAYGGPDGDGW